MYIFFYSHNNIINLCLFASTIQLYDEIVGELPFIITHKIIHFHLLNTLIKIQMEHKKSFIQLLHPNLKKQSITYLLNFLGVILGQKLFITE